MTVLHYYQGSEYKVVGSGVVNHTSGNGTPLNIIGTLPSNQRIIFSIGSDMTTTLRIKTPNLIYEGPANILGGATDNSTFPELSKGLHFATDYGGSLSIERDGVGSTANPVRVLYIIIERV